MRFQRVIQAVYFEPWAISRSGWQAVHQIVKPYADGTKTPPALGSDKPTEDFFGNPLPEMEITRDGVAIIPVKGTLIHHGTLMDRMCGACSYDDIKENISVAAALDEVERVVFHFDSPGGMAQGCEETARLIANLSDKIDTCAVTDGLCCSAAYYLACACDEICCTPTAEVGCIGTLLPIIDESEAWKSLGLEMNLFKSGKLKGAGFPGTSMDKAQEKYFQGIVDHFAGMFKEFVSEARPVVEPDSMEGQIFIGEQAKEAGLVDRIVDDCEECFEL